MRLWHSTLLPVLDGRRLCDTHMSCCNLRGKGWGKKNVSINYLYDDPLGEEALAVYHHMVLTEMKRRGYQFQQDWWRMTYCGKNRPERIASFEKYSEAWHRQAPLLGHTYQMLLNDILDLKERGLDIRARLDGRANVLYITGHNGDSEYKLKI